jgi:hypothetical protein
MDVKEAGQLGGRATHRNNPKHLAEISKKAVEAKRKKRLAKIGNV